ncbi:MAG: HNH endonuclease signature motif containing protein [Acidobacteriota bacterium]
MLLPRRTFCSQDCVDALLVRTSPSAARGRVFERDRGVCASCGLDTESRKRAIARLRRKDPTDKTVRKARELTAGFERAVTIRAGRPWIAVGRSLWEADHLVPVVEGGGGCGLENLRTLCIPCHHGVTSELARRRAASRRAAAAPPAGAGGG